MDRGMPRRCAALQRAAQGSREQPDRTGRRQAACDDAVDRGGQACQTEGHGAQTGRAGACTGVTRTLFDRVWEAHVVRELAGGVALLYVDLHLVHEVTSPQAFAGLKREKRSVRRPELTLATVDHNVPTGDRSLPIADAIAARQVDALSTNAREFGIELFDLRSPDQGIVHVIGPELGATQPGMLIVCGDSHTSTHGAFGAFALGIGTSEVEHVLATQCIVLNKPRNLEARISGSLEPGVGAKDLILALIGKIGTAGAAGHVVEYTGAAVRALSMEERITVCNMSIEAGARAGMIAPDEVTFAYLEGRPRAPQGAAWTAAVERWQTFRSDPDARYDTQVQLDASQLGPQVTWGTTPGMVADITARVPDPAELPAESDRQAAVRALVVPGSQRVKAQAEREGLDRVFREAGFEWRNAGCSMCLGMNADVLGAGERCAATSNRNFEGRQGRGGRTHLMSPVMAAAAAIEGRLVDVRAW